MAVAFDTDEEARFRTLSRASAEFYERACTVMPGGTTRTTVYTEPYPIYIARGRGSHVWDADGVDRLDLICNYSAMILGHCNPAVVRAITEQATRGTAFAAANPGEVELAEELCGRIPSVEQVRFTSSGTEATMFAMRLARAFTGRPKVARFEGGYHGTHDFAEVSTHPSVALAGAADRPRAVADSAGTHPAALENAVVLPFNDLSSTSDLLYEHAADVAALIVEPVLGAGGVIAADKAFLHGLRSLTAELGIVLIFDEIISLRVAQGGAQEWYGVRPDLTTMGKIIGGGLPVAAVGGRRDIMEHMNPATTNPVLQGGTFNGNPLGMAAGLAQLRQLTPQVYDDLNRKGSWLSQRLVEMFHEYEVPAHVTSFGSLLNVHFTEEPVTNYRSEQRANHAVMHEFTLGLLNRGVLVAPRGMMAICTELTDPELEQVVDAAEDVTRLHAADWARRVRG
jgi:glutamate-1-semialdehyde 2,1-aminomutase